MVPEEQLGICGWRVSLNDETFSCVSFKSKDVCAKMYVARTYMRASEDVSGTKKSVLASEMVNRK